MRELKLRVWNGREKTYDDGWDYLLSSDGSLYALKYGALVSMSGVDYLTVEFDTGFKDKNGKEIYKGDIIVDFDEFISVVDGSCAVISEKTCREKYFDEDDCSLERRTRPLIRVVNDYGYYPEKKETQVEVIGNIHENPELLEGEK